MRQGKPGEGGSDELKPSFGPSGTIPPGKGWRPAGTECCVVRGRPRLRSVHRECAGRTSSFEIVANLRGPTPCKSWKAAPKRRDAPPGAEASPESENAACAHWGSPGTWEVLTSPATSRTGHPVSVSRPVGPWRSTSMGAKKRARPVPPSEGNEARREGRQDVGAPRSTREAGEPTRGTRWREGGAGQRNRWRERCRGLGAPPASQRNCNG